MLFNQTQLITKMKEHLRGLSVLFFILTYCGVAFTFIENTPIYIKLFSLAFATWYTFQLLSEYLTKDEN